MAEVAVMKKWDDTFYFVSDDGVRFFEVSPAPRVDSDLDHLRPLGDIKDADGKVTGFRIAMDRNYLRHICTDPAAPGTVEFHTV